MASTVEQIKARLSITDLASGYVKLEKAGVNYKACCPFHSEKTPSFFISPSRDSFHCFGCGKGGDIFTFIQETEGLDFFGSLKLLAERTGVVIENTGEQNKGEKEKLLALLRMATNAYSAWFAKNADAQAYVQSRGINTKTVTDFEIGFAPDGWQVLYEFLRAKGYDEAAMEAAGLVIRSDKGRYYDRFRNRIMFPIKDHIGNVVGFSGRILSDEMPKYLNTPQTLVYDKSKALFGMDQAKLAIRKADAAILVEGQMDLVLSHQSGAAHAIAVSGTALTEEHLRSIKRLTNNLIMAFDADTAGVSASARAVNLALSLAMNVRIAPLPTGKDPADIVREKPDEWHARIKGARHVIDFYLDVYGAQTSDPHALRATIEKKVLPYLALLASPLDQGHFVNVISQRIGVSEAVVWDAVKKNPSSIAQKTMGSDHAPAPPRKEVSRSERILETLWGIMVWQKSLPDPTIDPNDVRGKLENLIGTERMGALAASLAPRTGEIVLQSEVAYGGSSTLEATIEELFINAEEDLLTRQFSSIMIKLRDAETRSDREAVDTYLAQCQAMSVRLSSLKTRRSSEYIPKKP